MEQDQHKYGIPGHLRAEHRGLDRRIRDVGPPVYLAGSAIPGPDRRSSPEPRPGPVPDPREVGEVLGLNPHTLGFQGPRDDLDQDGPGYQRPDRRVQNLVPEGFKFKVNDLWIKDRRVQVDRDPVLADQGGREELVAALEVLRPPTGVSLPASERAWGLLHYFVQAHEDSVAARHIAGVQCCDICGWGGCETVGGSIPCPGPKPELRRAVALLTRDQSSAQARKYVLQSVDGRPYADPDLDHAGHTAKGIPLDPVQGPEDVDARGLAWPSATLTGALHR